MKRIGLRMTAVSVLTFVVILLFGVYDSSPAATAALPLNIGVISTLTGPGSETFGQLVNGIQYGADWINEKGGVKIKGQVYTAC
jgi:ABC-type branched-subunit amino acid transport system substrate-binding protein